MRRKPEMIGLIMGTCCLWLIGMSSGRAQEEESAEIFLEAYTDLFQERFFEALKQKGIENYDRAEALLLECKQMQPDNPVVDHELAKVLAAQKQYASAEAYALTAVSAAPTEYWYMHTLMDILAAQYKEPGSLSGSIPLDMPEIRLNLAKWYLASGSGEKALEYLEGLNGDTEVLALREKARNLTGPADPAVAPDTDPAPPEVEMDASPAELTAYRNDLERLLKAQSWEEALSLGKEAVESYPLQPAFYLGIGKAYLGMGAYQEAIQSLEEGEFLILEPGPMAVELYQALAEAYSALGNDEKAMEYLNKAKAVTQ